LFYRDNLAESIATGCGKKNIAQRVASTDDALFAAHMLRNTGDILTQPFKGWARSPDALHPPHQ